MRFEPGRTPDTQLYRLYRHQNTILTLTYSLPLPAHLHRGEASALADVLHNRRHVVFCMLVFTSFMTIVTLSGAAGAHLLNLAERVIPEQRVQVVQLLLPHVLFLGSFVCFWGIRLRQSFLAEQRRLLYGCRLGQFWTLRRSRRSRKFLNVYRIPFCPHL